MEQETEMTTDEINEKYEKYEDTLTLSSKLRRLVWNVFSCILFKPFALPIFNAWRISVLRMFGAKIGKGSIVYASVRVWAPWNLEIGHRTVLAPGVNVYNPGKIVIGNKCQLSQYAYLCSASHNIYDVKNQLVTKPIVINDRAWVATDAFIGMGVTIGEGAVVGARAAVFKDVEAWTVVGGNPAKFIKKRELRG